MLDCLDRDETQGVIGHLLAAIANGAFHGALILGRLAAFLACSLLTLFVLGPFIVFAIRARRRLADATAVQLLLQGFV